MGRGKYEPLPAKGTGWKEDYSNEEGKIIRMVPRRRKRGFSTRFARRFKEVVKHFEKDNGRPMRGNHAKILVGIEGGGIPRFSTDTA